MRRSISLISGAALIAIFLLTGTTPLLAQNSQPPTISAAASDPALTTLFISGTNFSSTVAVYISGVQLSGVLIGNAGTTITATLPSILPGSYRLTVVQQAGNKVQSASFDITLGATGAAGPAGPIGPPGPAGADGAPGPAGADGAAGPAGPSGPQGPQGPSGPAGPAGPQGLPGADGAQGPAGPAGPQGPAGPSGPSGPSGPAGPMGPQGPQGVQGLTGPAGDDGVVATGFASLFSTASVPTGDAAIVFLGQTTVTVSAGQKIFVTSDVALGAHGTPATQLNLFICHKASTTTALTKVGGGSLDHSSPANTRQMYGLSAVINGLPAGTYTVGLCGYTDMASSTWTNNEWGYTSALVLQ